MSLRCVQRGAGCRRSRFRRALDATYIGPNPAINAFAESGGEAIRIIAGATSGGAQLVVREGIDSVEDLTGTTLATPQLGNTQDVALRAYLSENGLENSVEGGGDVTITPTPNADTLSLFQSRDFDGAWLPEPWASRLVLEAGAHVLVDEKELWPDGEFVTTHLIVRTEFLEQYPGTVAALLRAHVTAVDFANENADEAKEVVNAGIERDTGEALATEVLDRAWESLTVTDDPIAASLQTSADNAVAAGTSEEQVDLTGIYDLRPLNEILAELGEQPASAADLGEE
ncbi:MAG: ABC transporter substrate-binding protein [Actinomycetota bacterium]|nr:ABC transporter substrate-binding protein [Actinomycetota bacterium]